MVKTIGLRTAVIKGFLSVSRPLRVSPPAAPPYAWGRIEREAGIGYSLYARVPRILFKTASAMKISPKT